MTRTRKWIAGIGIALGALIVLLIAAWVWLLYTPSGLRFSLNRGVALMHGQFAYAEVHGTLAGPATIRGLRYRDAKGDVLRIARATINLHPWALLGGSLHVQRARLAGVDLSLGPGPSQAFPLHPPLTLILDDALLTGIKVRQAGQPVFTANSLAIAGAWSSNQILIRQLDLRAPNGTARAQGVLALAPGYRGHGSARLDWRRNGTRYVAELDARSDGAIARSHAIVSAPLRAQVDAAVKLDASRAWTLALAAPEFDAHAVPGLPKTVKTLALDLRGAGDAGGGALHGSLAINDYTLLLDPARFGIHGKTLTLDPLTVRSPQIAGAATATGTLNLDAQPINAALDLQWRDVLLPADLAGQKLATQGALHFRGSAQHYAANGALAIGPPGRMADLQLMLQGTPQQIALRTLKLVQKQGWLDAHGTVALQPRLAWKLDATARKFDPGALLAGWDGALDFALATQGALTPHGPQATLKLDHVAGSLRGRSVNGSHADLAITPDNLLDGTALLAIGSSRIRMQGQGGARTDATVALDIASLDDWLPQASGALQGNFHVRGAWPRLAIAGRLHGSHLSDGARHAEALRLAASIPDISQPGGDLDLRLDGVHAGLDFDSVHLDAHGTPASHRLQLTARGPQLDAALALQGSWNAKTKSWSGTLRDLHVTPHGMPQWRQQQPAALSWRNGAGALSQLCMGSGESRLCMAADRKPDGMLDARGQLQRLPLQALTTLVAGTESLRASGELSGVGQLRLRADGSMEGNANLQASAGSIGFASTGKTLLVWTSLSAGFSAHDQDRQVRLRGSLRDGGSLHGAIGISGADHALHGTVSADLRSLAFLEAFSAEVANVHGTLGGTLTLAGTLAAPQFGGSLQTRNFSAELPRAGLKLHDGRFAIQGDAQGRLHIAGQIASGEGVLHVGGDAGLGAGAPLSLDIRGENVLVTDIPAARVIASPDLHIARAQNLFALTGTLAIPQARVEVAKLPGQGPVKASSDVVVVDEKQPRSAVGEMPLQADITVKLGDKVAVKGYGFDGTAHGALAVRVRADRPPTARGEIRVDGTYRAYGQTLQIERGRLLFAGTRLDNPGLDMRATRTIRNADVTVGLSVRGTAQQPILTVFSDPPMQQAQALSWLVTGRPLESLKSGEADTLNTAAQALGGLAGDRLAKSLGPRLGLETGVSSSEALGGSAFTAGKYLSPRLFISYGVGLFTPGQVVTLRYTLNRFLQFEAENATTGNRASLNYKIEK